MFLPSGDTTGDASEKSAGSRSSGQRYRNGEITKMSAVSGYKFLASGDERGVVLLTRDATTGDD